jgi:phosphoglycolate phosphatase
MSRPRAILFDFDGTLIDSAPSILAGLGRALAREGVQPVVPLSASLIGPPLPRTLATLAGSAEPALIERLAAAYREDYDSTGFRQTAVYAGVEDMLQWLGGAGIILHIVTNKRIRPTRLILDHLGWQRHFHGVYALDALQPAAADKTALVREVLQRESLPAGSTWMVGDSADDQRAAQGNALRFLAAGWGYGLGADDAAAERLPSPAALLRHLQQVAAQV